MGLEWPRFPGVPKLFEGLLDPKVEPFELGLQCNSGPGDTRNAAGREMADPMHGQGKCWIFYSCQGLGEGGKPVILHITDEFEGKMQLILRDGACPVDVPGYVVHAGANGRWDVESDEEPNHGRHSPTGEGSCSASWRMA